MSESQQGPEICDVISRKRYLTIEVLYLLCFVGTILKQEKHEVCTFIWRIMKIPAGVICWGHTLLNLHNSSDDTKAQFNNCYILYATLQ